MPHVPLVSRRNGIIPEVGTALTMPAPRAGFMSSGRGIVMEGWHPALRDIHDDIGNSWTDAAARATDLVQNSGWIAGMFDQAVANTVGSGLRLRCMPENELFGMDEQTAQTWRKLVEQRFGLWASNPLHCDIEGRRTVAQMQSAAFRSWLATGEILAEIVYRQRYGQRYGTKVRLLPPHKLSTGTSTLERIISGVKLDRDGMPIAYVARRRDELIGEYEVQVAARDRYGRPRVIHVFSGVPGQVRGITPLVPALKVARQFDQLADATLMRELIQAVFAGVVTSDAPTDEILQGLLSPQEQAQVAATGASPFDAWYETQAGWYEGNKIDVGLSGRIATMFPGHDLKFLSPEQTASNYKEFSLHLLRELARCLGLTFESATGDYSGATYSSVRAAVNEIFPITKERRDNIIAPFTQPIFEAWLEEAIELGEVPFPGGLPAFLYYRDAAARATWPGAPKQTADELKTAKAHQIYRQMGVVTDEMIANDLGADIEDVYAQRAREMALRETYKLPELTTAQIAGGTPALPDKSDEDEENEEARNRHVS